MWKCETDIYRMKREAAVLVLCAAKSSFSVHLTKDVICPYHNNNKTLWSRNHSEHYLLLALVRLSVFGRSKLTTNVYQSDKTFYILLLWRLVLYLSQQPVFNWPLTLLDATECALWSKWSPVTCFASLCMLPNSLSTLYHILHVPCFLFGNPLLRFEWFYPPWKSCNAVQGGWGMPSFWPYILFILIQLSHKMVYRQRRKYDTISSIQLVWGGEMECAALVPP